MNGGGVRWLAAMAVGLSMMGAGAEEGWDEAGARKVVERVLAAEKGEQPWKKIAWVKDGAAAAAEAKRTGKPVLVFFHLAKGGPKEDPCGPAGRIMRSVILADPKVQALIKKEFVALNVGLTPGAEFPLDWPVLAPWERLFQFAGGRSFTGCMVISPDREVPYGTTGSLLLWELADARGFDAEKMRKVLELAAARGLEERVLRKQWGITEQERAEEIRRFRQGLVRAAREPGRFQLPPAGFSMEKVTGWFASED